jgi:type I restriction enzyme M protein
MNFSEAKLKFDTEFKNKNILPKSLVTVDGKFINNIKIKDIHDKNNEEYYKWQFISSLIQSKLYPRDHIGTEIYFPKGNKSSTPIKIDAVIFDSIDWMDYYKKYRTEKDQDALHRLREMAVAVIEFKRNDKKIEQVFSSQIRASIKEPDARFILGIYYDAERLYLFKKYDDQISRYDNSMNYPNSQRILEKYQLEITDPYYTIPSFKDLMKRNIGIELEKKDLLVEDLDIVHTITDENIRSSLNQILRTFDSVSLFNEEGYLILIQLIAIKIYDEKQSEQHGSSLRFYVNSEEYYDQNLSDLDVQNFLKRMQELYNEAKRYYSNILQDNKIEWKNVRHVRVVEEVVKQFQRYSFIRSRSSDLYQLVFYNFATKFKKEENAQFLTPIPIIDFMVNILNPRRNETVCDPCCGIGDFLSMSYVNSDFKLDDKNLYGFDNDYNMTLLALLNMLLNGDGNAIIKFVPDKGSINHKYTVDGEIKKLNPDYHKKGNWNEWVDNTELMKYDVILTNPPFGKGRNLKLNKKPDKDVAEFYETYYDYIEGNPKDGFDLGVVFLENAVRSIKEGGRFGIVLSNSIASNNSYSFARKWLMKHVRLVALFDLPPNVFAETNVNTTIIVGYKPSKDKLKKLIEDDYSVFVREVNKVGYVKRTSNRNVVFNKDYKLNEETFETEINDQGESRVNEDFSQIINEFKEWCVFQENDLRKLFLE